MQRRRRLGPYFTFHVERLPWQVTKYKSETCGSYCGGQTISAEFRLECIPFKALHTQSHAPTTPNSGVARRLTAMVTPPADADQITVYSQDWVSVSLNGRR